MNVEMNCSAEEMRHQSERVLPQFSIMILLKSGILIFLLGWSWLGLWLLLKYDQLFGLHPDDPAESPGARALNVTQVFAVWVGVFAMAVYFLIR